MQASIGEKEKNLDKIREVELSRFQFLTPAFSLRAWSVFEE
jgi:hypothetical protein